jgi:transposase
MLRYEEMIEIKVLHNQGYSVRKIAKQLNVSRNTVKKYLSRPAVIPQYKTRNPSKSKLNDYKDSIQSRLNASQPDKIPATVLFREIVEQGYKGSISLLRGYIRTLQFKQEEPVIRFETPPSKQLQVDWAEFCRRPCRISAFIATLGYSRMTYVEFVDNQRLETLLCCLSHAFDYFGGTPKQVLFDNMKTVVIQRNAYGEGQHRFQSGLWDFAKHYGFIPKLCAPYRAQTKGKVERFIGYLRRSFYVPLRASLSTAGLAIDIATANLAVKMWLAEVANSRIHATLKKRPIDVFDVEKPLLQPLPPTAHTQVLTVANDLSKVLPKRVLPIDIPIEQHHLGLYQQILEHCGV